MYAFMNNPMWVLIYGFMLICALITMAEQDDCENPQKPERHVAMRVVAWVLVVFGLLWYSLTFISILRASSKAVIKLEPSVFMILGLAGYFYFFKKSKSSVIKKLLKIFYIFALLLSYNGIFLYGAPYSGRVFCCILFLVLSIIKLNKMEKLMVGAFSRENSDSQMTFRKEDK